MYSSYPNYYQNYPNYQQNYQQPTQPTQPSPPMQQSQILAWVRSEEDGINFPLNAGQSIFLMNLNEPYLYMKSVDQLGKPTFIKKRLIDESDNKDSGVNLKEYIKKEEIEDIITDIVQKTVDKKMSEFSFKPTKSKKTVVTDDEE